MPYSGSHGEWAALYLDETIGGATAAFTFGASRIQFGALTEGFTGVIDPGGGTGVCRPSAGALDYIICTEAGWYRLAYHISGKITATADGGTLSITAKQGAVGVADGDVVPGSECSFVSLTGNLECIFVAETLAYLQENTYVALCHIQYSAGGAGVFHNGTLVAERINPGA